MPRNSIEEVPAVKQTPSLSTYKITLTPARTEHIQSPQTPVSVAISEMIAYSQGNDFTRLNLKGGKVQSIIATLEAKQGNTTETNR